MALLSTRAARAGLRVGPEADDVLTRGGL